jgi:hypothetical protein
MDQEKKQKKKERKLGNKNRCNCTRAPALLVL